MESTKCDCGRRLYTEVGNCPSCGRLLSGHIQPNIQAYAVMVGDNVDGIIRTPDAQKRAEAKVAELRRQGKDARAVPYDGDVRKPFSP